MHFLVLTVLHPGKSDNSPMAIANRVAMLDVVKTNITNAALDNLEEYINAIINALNQYVEDFMASVEVSSDEGSTPLACLVREH